jgi:hypothetical protein
MWQDGCYWRFLALPLAELAVFIAVARRIGFALASLLVLAGMFTGGLVLRHAGGSHILPASGLPWIKATSPPCRPMAPAAQSC